MLLSACASDTSGLDARWRHSLSQALAQQTAYPDSRNRLRGPIDTDGEIARLGIERVHQSYKNPPPPVNVLNLGMGNHSGNGP